MFRRFATVSQLLIVLSWQYVNMELAKRQLTHGSLFSGIGGFDLGFERVGIKTVFQVECDPYCLKVLEKHWPDVRRYTDVRTFLNERPVPPDILSGGFPCQDISNAGKRAGITGSRSGLWTEFRRAIVSLRPRYVVVENVAALYQRGLSTVLGDLAQSGYDAEWDCLPAAAVGAPHLRERIWIVAYSHRPRCFQQRRPITASEELTPFERSRWWTTEPALGRVAHGVPHRVDRLKCLGNAIVPQIAEEIGRMILAADAHA